MHGREARVEVLIDGRADDQHQEPAFAEQGRGILHLEPAAGEDPGEHFRGTLFGKGHLAATDLIDGSGVDVVDHGAEAVVREGHGQGQPDMPAASDYCHVASERARG